MLFMLTIVLRVQSLNTSSRAGWVFITGGGYHILKVGDMLRSNEFWYDTGVESVLHGNG